MAPPPPPSADHSGETASAVKSLIDLPREVLTRILECVLLDESMTLGDTAPARCRFREVRGEPVSRGLDILSLGYSASSCTTFAQLCAESQGLWAMVCARQGLSTRVSDVAGMGPMATLRRAARCDHATAMWPSSQYTWERCPSDGVVAAASNGQDERTVVLGECQKCGRRYEVRLSMGFVDTRAFASKLVTKATFVARFDAPAHQRTFDLMWDRAEASAAKQAVAAMAPCSESNSGLNSGLGTAWTGGQIEFFGARHRVTRPDEDRSV